VSQSLTLIIAVYNAARYLEFILAALDRQSMLDFEVIVADDGSGPEISQLIDSRSSDSAFQIKHLWQPHDGFRKNVMLNKAILASSTDYLIFIDGDCIPHREFIRDHWRNRMSNSVLCGRRVNWSKRFTQELELEDVTSGRFERLSVGLLVDGLMGKSTHLEKAIRIENRVLRRWLQSRETRIVGCNFSLEKSLIERVNGFNEDYHSPGLGEDSDVAHRLGLIGAGLVDLRHLAILYHLYHPQTAEGEGSKDLYEKTLASKKPVCRNGLRKL
jgi:cellulose synthase/poly-beta-1,6-N-acetylglucosamine synthase-like glycosyltransferase